MAPTYSADNRPVKPRPGPLSVVSAGSRSDMLRREFTGDSHGDRRSAPRRARRVARRGPGPHCAGRAVVPSAARAVTTPRDQPPGRAWRRALPDICARELAGRPRRLRPRHPARPGTGRRDVASDRQPHRIRRPRVDLVRLPRARVPAAPVHRGSGRAPRAVPEGSRPAALDHHLRPVDGRPHRGGLAGAAARPVSGRPVRMRPGGRGRHRRLPHSVHRGGRTDLGRAALRSARPRGLQPRARRGGHGARHAGIVHRAWTAVRQRREVPDGRRSGRQRSAAAARWSDATLPAEHRVPSRGISTRSRTPGCAPPAPPT